MHILLVDDHAFVRDAMRTLFATEPDLDVVGEALNGQHAIELADRLHPDLVLMDVNMPVMDGIQATRHIHAAHPDLPIISFSIYDHVEALMRVAGAVACIGKDVPLNELLAVIRASHGDLQALPAAA